MTNAWAGFGDGNFSGVKNAGSYDSEIGPFDWKAALPDQVGTAGRLYELTDDSGTAWYPAAGSRNSGTAVLQSTGNNGGYWSASTSGGNGVLLYFSNSSVYPVGNNSRAYGFSVRCVHK
ncbi:hypothetical protein [Bacteroides stercoris]|uniref:hypothetical protein n=1 Tax=Bacteroides stercoris TaxID=46506 RepID=UPI003561C253